MHLQNNFTNETRQLFEGCKCFWCDLGTADAIHHIKGRESRSPLNACPVHNDSCHFHIAGALGVASPNLMRKTILFLHDKGYILTHTDIEFIDKYQSVYIKLPPSLLGEMGYPLSTSVHLSVKNQVLR